jgi:hypothetical protein
MKTRNQASIILTVLGLSALLAFNGCDLGGGGSDSPAGEKTQTYKVGGCADKVCHYYASIGVLPLASAMDDKCKDNGCSREEKELHIRTVGAAYNDALWENFNKRNDRVYHNEKLPLILITVNNEGTGYQDYYPCYTEADINYAKAQTRIIIDGMHN